MTSNIKKVCLICSQIYKRTMVASYILSKERTETLLKFAILKCDDIMIEKIQESEKFDYEHTNTHKTCFLSYTSMQNFKGKRPVDHDLNPVWETFFKSFEKKIFDNNEVCKMDDLRNEFISLQGENWEGSLTYIKRHFKEDLIKKYPDRISFFNRAGKSSLVCDKECDVECLIRKIEELEKISLEGEVLVCRLT